MPGSIVLKPFALGCILGLWWAQQCPNQFAVYNPNIRSTCINSTFFIVPIDKATVAKAVAPYKLLTLPTTDKALFLNDFPSDKPVVVNSENQSELVPYVDRLNEGKTRFVFSAKQYIGGYTGKYVSSLVPALVGSLGGTPIYVANFVPNNAAYQLISYNPPEFISHMKHVIVPNTVSGPGVIEEAFDTDFVTASTTHFTAHTFHDFLNRPLILANGLCPRNPVYLNFTFSDPAFRMGKLTLSTPGGAFAGVFKGVAGYSAAGNLLGCNAETCQSAAANADPKALA